MVYLGPLDPNLPDLGYVGNGIVLPADVTLQVVDDIPILKTERRLKEIEDYPKVLTLDPSPAWEPLGPVVDYVMRAQSAEPIAAYFHGGALPSKVLAKPKQPTALDLRWCMYCDEVRDKGLMHWTETGLYGCTFCHPDADLGDMAPSTGANDSLGRRRGICECDICCVPVDAPRTRCRRCTSDEIERGKPRELDGVERWAN